MKHLFALNLLLFALTSSARATLAFIPIDITTGTGSTATMSTPAAGVTPPGNGFATNALNGNLGDFTHTSSLDPNPTWTGNLNRNETFNTILVYNRSSCCGERLSDITVSVLDSFDAPIFTTGVLNPANALGAPALLSVNTGAAVTGSQIRVARDGASLIGAQGILSIGEVRIGNLMDVFLPLGTNLTQSNIASMTVAQSPTSASPPGGGFAGNAVNNNFADFTHTNANETVDHTWRVDFGEMMLLESVSMFNRSNCCGERLRDITVSVLDGMGGTVFTSALLNPGNILGFTGVNQGGLDVNFSALNGGSPIVGRTVVITRTRDAVGPTADDRSVLSLGEVQVFGGTIPEPSSVLFLGFSAFALLFRRRR